jgi:DNA/RNA endonuclease YhcR with UshA esterase domain
MKIRLPLTLTLVCVSLFFISGLAQKANRLTASEAKNHVGKTATVCGLVASAKYAMRSKGKPTFLNLDKSYPNPIFITLIWEEDRPKFGTPETDLKGKRICVTGNIESYRGTPQIVLPDRGQLEVE